MIEGNDLGRKMIECCRLDQCSQIRKKTFCISLCTAFYRILYPRGVRNEAKIKKRL